MAFQGQDSQPPPLWILILAQPFPEVPASVMPTHHSFPQLGPCRSSFLRNLQGSRLLRKSKKKRKKKNNFPIPQPHISITHSKLLCYK